MTSARDFLLSKFQTDPNVNNRVNDFYIPVLNWAKSFVKKEETIIIGINGPQGSGKSTLCEALVEASRLEGLHASTLSIDDFYLTREEQIKVAALNSTNPYLQQRGYPGTHAVELGTEILSEIKNLKKEGQVLCPQYDKSAYNGQGDREPKENWRKIKAPLDILFFEGWMLGFPTVSESALLDPHFIQINSLLKAYSSWNGLIDAFLQLYPSEKKLVIGWRTEAEEKRKLSGKTGMSKEEITEYVKKFLPAYEIYLPVLKKSPPVPIKNFSSYVIGPDRLPL